MSIWHKVWRDVASNKIRTLLVVLSVGVGVFALGLVFGLSSIMRARMTEAQLAVMPSHITFWLSPFDQDVVTTIRKEPGVLDAEGSGLMTVRWKKQGEDTWRNGTLVMRRSFISQHMNLITLVSGEWPRDRTVGVEKLTAQYYGIPPGTAVILSYGRRELAMPVVGSLHDSSALPPEFGGDAQFYCTPDTRAWLTGNDRFDQLHVRIPAFSTARAAEVATSIQKRLEDMNIVVNGHLVTDPDVHPLQATFDTVFLILTLLGTLSLGLSVFLIINTINAVIAQQVWQIGVMKVVGATFWRVMRIYLVGALLYGLLALALAVPLGVVAANAVSRWLLGLINIQSGPSRVVPEAIGLQVMVGLVVPLVAALAPVINGARITPHQAITSYGLGTDFGRGWLDGLLTHLRGLPRPLALSIRNAFRRKIRIFLTLVTLLLGGVLFIVVMSIGESLSGTINTLVHDLGMDVIVGLQRPYRNTIVTPIAEGVPGVARAEVWDREAGLLAVPGGQKKQIYLWGVPTDSVMMTPRLTEGRALLPGDSPAIVLNKKIATDAGIHVGQTVTITVGGRDVGWTVVGLMLNVNNDQLDNYVPFNTLSRAVGWSNQGSVVAIRLDRGANTQAVMLDLRTALSSRNIEVAFVDSANDLRLRAQSQFDVLMSLLLAMSFLAALVGSFGLAGTMSISVVERSREIGVMRAIGATSGAIVRIVATEGMLLAFLSWLVAVPLSLPAAQRFSTMVGYQLLKVPLDFHYSLSAVGMWLVIVLFLSAIASLLPAQRASRMSVREALAYE